ncbi:unnamed protein product [Lymnaea stagnalis]|uniref:TMEM248/TMEM219 domain-containing protein n=1 Tax=Lymnaea stagnalis TaxID=6523 RepID=A0AAV2HKZ3_LYMST
MSTSSFCDVNTIYSLLNDRRAFLYSIIENFKCRSGYKIIVINSLGHIKMTFIIVENLRGFFNSRPPLVVFMICLASFAIALITFAYIVKTKDMPNPDISEDWNTFLTRVSHLAFCVPHNTSLINSTTSKMQVGDQSPADIYNSIKNKMKDGKTAEFISPTLSLSHVAKRSILKEDTSSFQALPGSSERTSSNGEQYIPSTTDVSLGKETVVNITLYLNIQITPSPELLALPLSMVHFTAPISGNMLGIKGSNSEEKIFVTFTFPNNLSMGTCEEYVDTECRLHVINTCVTFSGPASMMPHTQKPHTSETCIAGADSLGDGLMRNMTAAALVVSSSIHWCVQGARMTMQYSFDESLTVMLTQQDRSMINLHLMRTSYFLFVMVVTLFCYALIKGRPGKMKTVHAVYDKVSSQP